MNAPFLHFVGQLLTHCTTMRIIKVAATVKNRSMRGEDLIPLKKECSARGCQKKPFGEYLPH